MWEENGASKYATKVKDDRMKYKFMFENSKNRKGGNKGHEKRVEKEGRKIPGVTNYIE